METRRRTAVKAVIWSAIGWLVMAAVGWLFTGSVAAGGTMAAVNTALGLLTYIAYERVWAGIRWGRLA